MEIGEAAKAAILSEALGWMLSRAGSTVVVKYGGAAMKDEAAKDEVARDLVLMGAVGVRVVLVHGGGPEIDAMLARVGIERRFEGGLRVTDEATMEIVQMVLAGKVNKGIVDAVQRAGGRALGLCGLDGGMLKARKLAKGGLDLGRVGEIACVDPEPVLAALDSGYIPVVATVAASVDGGGSYNVNADTAAADLAAALGAEELVLLTDVPGVLRDLGDPGSLVAEIGRSEVDSLVETGVVSGGMIPKVECCARAVDGGVRRARIVDGRSPHALLLDAFSKSGAGTAIV